MDTLVCLLYVQKKPLFITFQKNIMVKMERLFFMDPTNNGKLLIPNVMNLMLQVA